MTKQEAAIVLSKIRLCEQVYFFTSNGTNTADPSYLGFSDNEAFCTIEQGMYNIGALNNRIMPEWSLTLCHKLPPVFISITALDFNVKSAIKLLEGLLCL